MYYAKSMHGVGSLYVYQFGKQSEIRLDYTTVFTLDPRVVSVVSRCISSPLACRAQRRKSRRFTEHELCLLSTWRAESHRGACNSGVRAFLVRRRASWWLMTGRNTHQVFCPRHSAVKVVLGFACSLPLTRHKTVTIGATGSRRCLTSLGNDPPSVEEWPGSFLSTDLEWQGYSRTPEK